MIHPANQMFTDCLNLIWKILPLGEYGTLPAKNAALSLRSMFEDRHLLSETR
jgi:hypothetical protein